MLAAASRRLTKSASFAKKRRTGATKTRKFSLEAIVPELKLATFEGTALKQVQAFVDQVNSDPERQKSLLHAVDLARENHALRSAFWAQCYPLYGVELPKTPLQEAVFGAVFLAADHPLEEFTYALRAYQSKLQTDEAFYKANLALKSTDAKVAQQSRDAVLSFIESIPTKSDLAKKGVLHLIRSGQWEGIKTGAARRLANDYISRISRELKVEVTTAHKMSKQEEEHWTSRFHQAAKDERTSIKMTTKEDPSILGGVIVSINGDVYDESWKRQQDSVMKAIANSNSL